MSIDALEKLAALAAETLSAAKQAVTKEMSPEDFVSYAMEQLGRASQEVPTAAAQRMDALRKMADVANRRVAEFRRALNSNAEVTSLGVPVQVYQEQTTRLKEQEVNETAPARVTQPDGGSSFVQNPEMVVGPAFQPAPNASGGSMPSQPSGDSAWAENGMENSTFAPAPNASGAMGGSPAPKSDGVFAHNTGAVLEPGSPQSPMQPFEGVSKEVPATPAPSETPTPVAGPIEQEVQSLLKTGEAMTPASSTMKDEPAVWARWK